MLFLILGRGKTGSIVAEVAREHGHSVRVLGEEANSGASALTPPALAGVDVVLDFTTPRAVVPNLRACLASGARVVVGTTGWYGQLAEMRALCERRGGALLYGSNFSLGVQKVLELARSLARLEGYSFRIEETHHAGKLDAPSGTALTIREVMREARPGAVLEIVSHREGDSSGIHIIAARSKNDSIEIRHESFSRRGFAEGAVRAAEWLHDKRGCYEFREIADRI